MVNDQSREGVEASTMTPCIINRHIIITFHMALVPVPSLKVNTAIFTVSKSVIYQREIQICGWLNMMKTLQFV